MNRLTHIFAALLLLSGTAAAQEDKPARPAATGQTQGSGFAFASRKCTGPINVDSDAFEGDFNTKVGIYTGNVVVTQAECKLRADKVRAEAIQSNDINRLTAISNVVFNSSSGTATGDNGVYELGPKLVTLTGKKVVLTKGKDVMVGNKLVVDMNTGLAHLTAKGRVSTSFIPKDQQNQGQPKASQGQQKTGSDGSN